MRAKAAHKILVKLTTGVNFINVKRTNFSYKRRFFTYMYLEKSCQNDVSNEKFVRKLLMKLTADGRDERCGKGPSFQIRGHSINT